MSLPRRQLASRLYGSGASSHVVLKSRDRICIKCFTELHEFDDIEPAFAALDLGDERLSISKAFRERGLTDVRMFPQIPQER